MLQLSITARAGGAPHHPCSPCNTHVGPKARLYSQTASRRSVQCAGKKRRDKETGGSAAATSFVVREEQTTAASTSNGAAKATQPTKGAAPKGAAKSAPSAAAAAATAEKGSASAVTSASKAAATTESSGGAAEVQQVAEPLKTVTEIEYLTGRSRSVQKHFDSALGQDDFVQRVEMALCGFGFTGDNSISMVNLCRDEVTLTLKHKIEEVFGSAFSTNGLGGVLTCGVTGMGAGFSHSPVCDTGRERYVFFSFPHISINSKGEVGPMSRPGRPGQSCACGALIASLGQISTQGLSSNCKIPGVHDALDPEYSILKQRLARRLRYEGANDESVQKMTLVDMTKVAERTITDDLEYLISKTVDPAKADYAVVTGVQIHNWGTNFDDESPNLEFVAPTAAYVVINGVKTNVDLAAMPPLTPRQTKLLAGGDDVVCNQGGVGTLREADAPYHFDSKDMRRAQTERLTRYEVLIDQEGLSGRSAPYSPTYMSKIAGGQPARREQDNSTMLDQQFAADEEMQQIQKVLAKRYTLPAVRPKAAAAAPANPVATSFKAPKA